MTDGFLQRWSRRKQSASDGRALPEPSTPNPQPPPAQAGAPGLPAAQTDQANVRDAMPGTPDLGQPATPPAPTLDDVMALKADSSYAPFVARDVAPEVRNAAMKKLFADPHYKLMDGLDIYVGDYSLPDPLPPSMLRQLASAKFMNLFDDDPKPPTGEAGLSDQPIAMPPAPDTLATPAAPESTAENPAHDHTDLRLQPDHAPGPAQPERVLK